jgi:hypothetical protein
MAMNNGLFLHSKNTLKTNRYAKKSSKSEAPYKLEQRITAIYATMSALESKEETKVIPPDCFF